MANISSSAKALVVASAVAVAIAGSAIIRGAAPATQPTAASLLGTMSVAPQPSARATLVAMPFRPVLPKTVVQREPRLLRGDAPHALHAHKAVDRPPLADASASAPLQANLPAGPLIKVPTIDASAIPVATL